MAASVCKGDVFEFATSRGLAYAQYAHDDPSDVGQGELLRVVPGLFAGRPPELEALVAGPEQFWSFSNLHRWVAEEGVRRVDAFDVPPHARRVPALRQPGFPAADGSPTWWIIENGLQRPVDRLGPEERRLSLAGLPTYDAFVARLEQGYRPELEPDEPYVASMAGGSASAPPAGAREGTTHYLIFGKTERAAKAADAAAGLGYEVDVMELPEGDGHVCLITETALTSDRERAERVLTELAARHGGQYDGSQTPV